MWYLLRKHNDEFETESLALSNAGLYDVVGDEDKTERAQTIADPQIRTPEQIFIESEMRAELREARRRIPKRENDYLDYRYGFIDDAEHELKETAEHFHLTVSRAKSTEKPALDNLWLELPWWYELRRDLVGTSSTMDAFTSSGIGVRRRYAKCEIKSITLHLMILKGGLS